MSTGRYLRNGKEVDGMRGLTPQARDLLRILRAWGHLSHDRRRDGPRRALRRCALPDLAWRWVFVGLNVGRARCWL